MVLFGTPVSVVWCWLHFISFFNNLIALVFFHFLAINFIVAIKSSQFRFYLTMKSSLTVANISIRNEVRICDDVCWWIYLCQSLQTQTKIIANHIPVKYRSNMSLTNFLVKVYPMGINLILNSLWIHLEKCIHNDI